MGVLVLRYLKVTSTNKFLPRCNFGNRTTPSSTGLGIGKFLMTAPFQSAISIDVKLTSIEVSLIYIPICRQSKNVTRRT